jgi:hypothetical protein
LLLCKAGEAIVTRAALLAGVLVWFAGIGLLNPSSAVDPGQSALYELNERWAGELSDYAFDYKHGGYVHTRYFDECVPQFGSLGHVGFDKAEELCFRMFALSESDVVRLRAMVNTTWTSSDIAFWRICIRNEERESCESYLRHLAWIRTSPTRFNWTMVAWIGLSAVLILFFLSHMRHQLARVAAWYRE